MFSIEDLLGTSRRIVKQHSVLCSEFDENTFKILRKPQTATLYILSDGVAVTIVPGGCCGGGKLATHAWRLSIVQFSATNHSFDRVVPGRYPLTLCAAREASGVGFNLSSDRIGLKATQDYTTIGGRRACFVLFFASAREREGVLETVEATLTAAVGPVMPRKPAQTLTQPLPLSPRPSAAAPAVAAPVPTLQPQTTTEVTVESVDVDVLGPSTPVTSVNLDTPAGQDSPMTPATPVDPKLRPHARSQQRQSARIASVLAQSGVQPLHVAHPAGGEAVGVASLRQADTSLLMHEFREMQKEKTAALPEGLRPTSLSSLASGEDLNVSALHPFPPQTESEAADKNATTRYNVYKEMYTSEASYVGFLQVILKVFVKPLQLAIVENRQIISTEEIDAIFGSIGNILSVNAELLQSLERNVCRSLDARLSSSVSDAFIKLMPFFRTYNEYCNNFWTASIRLRDISDANSAFHGFLRYCYKRPETKGMDLASLLVMPVQRIMRYPMLFQRVLEHMPQDHPHRPKLLLALDIVDKVSREVDEHKHNRDKELRMVELYHMFGGTQEIMKAGRKLILEEARGVSLSYLKADKPGGTAAPTAPLHVHVVLFNDLLILAEPKEGMDGSNEPNSHTVLEAIDLAHMKLKRYAAESRQPQDIPKFHILKWSQSVTKGELQTTADQLTIWCITEDLCSRLYDNVNATALGWQETANELTQRRRASTSGDGHKRGWKGDAQKAKTPSTLHDISSKYRVVKLDETIAEETTPVVEPDDKDEVTTETVNTPVVVPDEASTQYVETS